MFNTLEELQAAVEDRRQAILTLEVSLGGPYSPEHEAAKQELAQAKGMKTLAGGGFLGDNIEALEAKVEETRPEAPSVWLRFNKLPLGEFTAIMKQGGLNVFDQFEKVLPKTFIGVWGQDPDLAEDGEVIEPLSTDPALVSTKGDRGILPGGALHSVVQNFMNWQNSGGDVSIRPTKSGRA